MGVIVEVLYEELMMIEKVVMLLEILGSLFKGDAAGK